MAPYETRDSGNDRAVTVSQETRKSGRAVSAAQTTPLRASTADISTIASHAASSSRPVRNENLGLIGISLKRFRLRQPGDKIAKALPSGRFPHGLRRHGLH